MSNKYEREIEEILRNLENTGSKSNPGERLRRKPGDRPKPRGRRSFSFPQLKPNDWFIVVAVAAALIAGGYAYVRGPDIFTGFIAIIGFVCLMIVVISPFISRSSSRPYSRGENITRLRYNPFRGIVTRWNLFMLKRRYHRKDDL